MVAEINKLRNQNKLSEAISKVESYLKQANSDDAKELISLKASIINEIFAKDYQIQVRQIREAINQNNQSLAIKQLETLKRLVNDKKTNGDTMISPESFNEVEKWIYYFDYYFKAVRLFKERKFKEARIECDNAKDLCTNPEEVEILTSKIKEQEAIEEKENSYRGEVPLYIFETMNVPKKENEGEDADPLIIGNKDTKWGVLAVLDGMGGAGARKYRHKDNNEEHTAAYWASRIVRHSIEDFFTTGQLDESPIARVDSNIHNFIKHKLDKAILDFPNASSNVLSKMSHKLPTTLAMAVYEINDDVVSINSYWAGDSRIIVLTEDGIIYLTLDDADAPDGDPISPQNMDLPMNNAIYQDGIFRINCYQTKIPISENKPFMLIASTDGCFGYFHNPIEFESMMRKSISEATTENEIMDNIKHAIIENIQQDDFSMAMIAFGYSNFEQLKASLTKKLTDEESLASSYYTWRNSINHERKQIEDKLKELEEELLELKQKRDCLHDEDARENINWYSRYKETITIVKQEDIKTI